MNSRLKESSQDLSEEPNPLIHPLRWLFLDLNSYFASVEAQENPKLRGTPFGVVAVKSEKTACIAVSYEAKKFGIKGGTPVYEARKLCPKMKFIEATPHLYVKYHNEIVDAVESCLPVTHVMSIDEMACRLTGSDRREKNAVKLAYEVKRSIKEKVGHTLTCSVGIAPNRFLAKVGSDMQKPDGLTVLRDSELPSKLYDLKISDFPGIGHGMKKKINSFGVHTTEDLFSLTKNEMRSVWGGIVGERFWCWLRGEDIEIESAEKKTVGHSHVLPPSQRNIRDSFEVAQKLTHKAAERLRRYGLWSRGLAISVRFYDNSSVGSSWAEKVRFTETQDTLTFIQVLKSLWKGLQEIERLDETSQRARLEASSRPMGWNASSYKMKEYFSSSQIKGMKNDSGSENENENRTLTPHSVAVTLYDLVDETGHTLSLFDQKLFGGGEKRVSLSKALDRVNKRYGRDIIYFGGIHRVREAAPARIAFTQIPDEEDF